MIVKKSILVWSAVWVAILLALTPLSYGDGVTIITHGYNPSVSGTPAWLASMRDAINSNFLGGATNTGTITVSGSVGSLVATCSPWNVDLASGSNGDIIILLDWSAVADHLTSHVTAQSVAAAVVDKIVTGQNGKRALAELPIHLIGHSRGGGLVCELARLLGERGVVVDHLTPLDPHPLTAGDTQPVLPPTPIIDTPAAIYQNVVFADVYYQTASSPVGQYVTGAYNRRWTTALAGGYHNNTPPYDTYADHRNVLLMYQGSVNSANPLYNGEASMGATERAAWFNAYEVTGTNTGFIYSRMVGAGARTSTNTPVASSDAVRAGLNNAPAFGGGGVRSNLTWSAAVWPNVARLDVLTNGASVGSGTCQITIGSIQQLRYAYLNYSNGCTVTLHVDTDRNPYNNNDVAIISTQVFASATGATYMQFTNNWNTAGLSTQATVYIYASVSDGARTRYFYAEPRVTLVSGGPAGTNHPPVAGFGTALQFNGVDDYVEIADANDLDMTQNYTLECWFKADNLGNPGDLRGLIDKYQSNGSCGWLLRLSGTDLNFDEMTTSSLNLQTGTWYHVAAVNTNGTRHLYLNGVERALSGSPFTVQANSDPVRLASDFGGRYFAGALDEVRIWKQALSGTIVSNWMYRSVDLTHPAVSNLVAYYKLDDATGLTAADSAGLHAGTLNNMSGSEWTNSTVGLVYTVTAGHSVNGYLPGSDPDGSSSNGANWAVSFEIVNPGTYGTATVISANAFTYAVPARTGVVDHFTYRVRDASNTVSSVSTVMVFVASAPSNHPPVAGFGAALQFNGVDNYVSLPTALATAVGGKEAITIEYWFKGAQLQSPVRIQDGGGWIVAGWGATGPKHIISTDGGTAGVSVGPESTVENGQWHHLAMTWQRNTVNGFKSYMDGALVAQRDSADVALPSLSSATPYLGCINGNGEYLAGCLDEVRIWNQALSGTVISNWTYRSIDSTHPAFVNLVAYYKLDDGTGLTATDSTGAYPGSLSGAAWTNSTAGALYAGTAGQSLGGYLSGSDPDGASSNGADWALSFEIVNQPAHGTATVVSANSFIYPVPLGANPAESFTYRVRDSSSAVSGVSTVMVAVGFPAPFVDITNIAATVQYAVTSYTIGGTNNASVAGAMWWTNGANGASSTFAATNPWQAAGIPLAVGTNQISVFGTNASGVSANDSVAINRSAPPPTTHYVWTNSPSATAPYTNWATAAHTIQAAVNAANGGDTVLVTNGTYATGGTVTPGYSLTNRVCITNSITVQSVNGPSVTCIVGAADPATNGPAAVRCVYLSAGSGLGGFTLTNGHTLVSGDFAYDRSGGGVFADGDGVISNCSVLGCSAESNGGGINNNSGALTVNNCLLAANLAGNVGGGVYDYGTVKMNNCTVGGNSAGDGGGVRGNGGLSLFNCIVFANSTTGEGNPNYSTANFTASCTTPDPEGGGTGNITSDPQFFGSGDYRLRSGSPCVDMGNNAYASGGFDLLGKSRIVNGSVDMGAYEFQRLLVITNPASGSITVFGEVATYTIGGTNAPSLVGKLAWTNGANGSNGTLAAVSPWTIPSVPLAWGANVIVVRGTNAAGVVSDDAVQIFRSTVNGAASPIHYVWTNSPSAAWPYTNWTTAAHAIQQAVDAADSNDTVLATNGTYSTGGGLTPDYALSNRVCVTRPITLRSVNGPAKTIIVGAADPASTNGPAAVRCVYMVTASVLSGFTLTNGHTLASGDYARERSGGGAFLDGCAVSNCFVSGNSANYYGGGLYVYNNGLNLSHSIISGNLVDDGSGSGDGGGVACDGGTLAVDNCLFTGNQAAYDGGAIYSYSDSSVSDSTISGNSASYGGGIYGDSYAYATLNNSIVFGNAANDNPSYHLGSSTFDHCCTSPDPGGDANGIVIADPLFIGNGNYRLRSSSPCVDTGTNESVVGGADLDGNPRIVRGTADMGAYEFQRLIIITNPATGFSTAHQTVTYTISGTNAASIVGIMTWTNRVGGTGGTLPAALHWTTSSIPLLVGDNTIVVTGSNAAGVLASDAVTIQRTLEDSGASPVHYVWTSSPASAWPYTNWMSAAHTIQDAVDTASSGDTVLVTNGVYAAGGAVTPNYILTNRVCITKAITVRSINGPANTFIVGVSDPAGYAGNGPASVRCVYLVTNVVVSGFTLTNGSTAETGDWLFDESGGGAFLNGGGILTNCALVGNTTYYEGGGALCNYGGTLNNCSLVANSSANDSGGGAWCEYGGTLNNCTLTGNSVSRHGGGVYCDYGGTLNNCAINDNSADYGGGIFCGYGGTLNNCALRGNSASSGGGGAYCEYGGTLNNCTFSSNLANDGAGVYCVWGGTLNNCKITENSANNQGGGAYYMTGSTLNNCTVVANSAGYGGGVYCDNGGTAQNTIVYGNAATISDSNAFINGTSMIFAYCCATPDPGGTGNITNNPQFVNAPATNYHLLASSPCINTGTNQAWMVGATDLDGNLRIFGGGRVDMGAYEYQGSISAMSTNWLAQYGLPIDGSSDYLNPDGDAFNNWQEYVAGTDPTNATAYFRVTAVSNRSPWTVYFQSNTGRLYTLNGTSNLVNAVWTNVPGAGPRLGAGGLDSMPDTNVPPKGPFYRMKVELP